MIKLVALLLSIFTLSPHSFAAGSTFSMGLNFGIATSDQSDMNTLITRAVTRESGLGVSQLGNAWDINAMFTYRATDLVALQFRPGMYYVSEDGSSSSGSFEYSVVGFTVFPVMRLYLLENNFIAFFSNISVGWGYANGTVKEGDAKAEFSGSNLGYMIGLGAEFCFFGANHCMNIEGNFRYLDIERVTADSASGTFAANSLTQASPSQEVEINGRDLGLNMSGVVGLLGYIYYF